MAKDDIIIRGKDETLTEVEQSLNITYIRKVEPYIKDIVKWRQEGKGINEICFMLDIHPSTFFEYRKKYPELSKAFELGTELLVDQIETSLYKEATGYNYEEDTVSKSGDIVRVVKYARPQVAAQKFSLTNLRSSKWKNKNEQSNNTTVSGINIEALKELSKEDIKKLLEAKDED